MPRKYTHDAKGNADLAKFFPSNRDAESGVFEIAIAAAGGTSTGAYVAGVLDFIIEALDAWEQWRAGRNTHVVKINVLTGTSAGALSVGLAAQFTLKQFPPVYQKDKWDKLRAADPKLPNDQPAGVNPLYRAWVEEIDLSKLLAAPDPQIEDIALFAPAPEAIRDLTFKMMSVQPDRTWPAWARTPLELRLTVTNLRGVPFALRFHNTARVGERLNMHQDHVAFALATNKPHLSDVSPDAHVVTQCCLNRVRHEDTPALALLKSSAIASSAIPLVFAPIAVKGQSPDVYDWRDSYYDTVLKVPVLDLPAWRASPHSVNFTAADGGLLNNSPFMLAHKALAGNRGTNPQSGHEANRAVILIVPIIEDEAQDPGDPVMTDPGAPAVPFSPFARLLRASLRVLLAPMEQAQLASFDLEQAKSSSIFSRYMICPSREHPGSTSKAMMGPSRSLMSLPVHAIMGFASKAYREHDFFLGRRNAQRFLSHHFKLPVDNPLIKVVPTEVWDLDPDDIRDGIRYVPIIPLRGTARVAESLPKWEWEALTSKTIVALGAAFNIRARAIWKQVGFAFLQAGAEKVRSSALRATLKPLIRVGLWAAWCVGVKGMLNLTFTKALTDGRNSLDPSNIPSTPPTGVETRQGDPALPTHIE